MTKNQLKAILIGAGDRGINTYGLYAINNPDDLNFIAVAEPDPNRRSSFQKPTRFLKNINFLIGRRFSKSLNLQISHSSQLKIKCTRNLR